MKSGLHRERMPKKRNSMVFECNISGHDLTITFGQYEDGSFGEVFIDLAKEGSELSAWANCFAIAISLGLQHGIPPDKLIKTFSDTKFGFHGATDYEGLEVSSVPDLVMKIMEREG
jgi:ribonucleoside-diphosphate reductase alpha chain